MTSSSTPTSKTVMFFSPYASWQQHTQFDAVIAKALQLRNCDVVMVGCQGFYQNCTVLRSAKRDIKEQACQGCAKVSHGYFQKLFDLPYVSLHAGLEEADYKAALQWLENLHPDEYPHATDGELPIGRWVLSSIYSYFRISSLDQLQRPPISALHRQYLFDALLTYKSISRLLERYQPTNLFLFNGRFAPYRVVFEAARQRGIEVIVHERGYIDDSFALFDNQMCLSPEPAAQVVEAWRDLPMSNAELQRVKQLFTNRERGVDLNWLAFYNFTTNYTEVLDKLAIPQGARILSVFTSSQEELAAFEEYMQIQHQLDIIDRLIEVFSTRSDYLVVRHHPNIWNSKTYPIEPDFLARAYQQALSAPENVRIVMPSERLTSYALLWHTDATIAFFSTMALESMSRCIPTATLEASPYHEGLCHLVKETDTTALANLVEDLLAPKSQATVTDLQTLYRFTRAYFLKFSNKFRVFGMDSQQAAELRLNDLEQLQPGYDATLDRVCNRVLSGSALYDLPTDDRRSGDDAEEIAFYQQELLECDRIRQEVRQQTQAKSSIQAIEKIAVVTVTYPAEQEQDQLLKAWMQRSRYRHLVPYSIPATSLEDPHLLSRLMELISSIPEDYILVTNGYTQYDESCLLTAINILLEEVMVEDSITSEGFFWGGVLSSGSFIEEGVFIEGLFGQDEHVVYKQPVLDYAMAVHGFPFLKYFPTLLSFGLIRKRSLLEMLTSLQLDTPISLAEQLFDLVQNAPMTRVYSPLMVIHQGSSLFRSLNQQDTLQTLQGTLNLNTYNVLVRLDWEQSEEMLTQAIRDCLIAYSQHPDRDHITLLVDRGQINYEDAYLMLSGVVMDCLMEEQSDLEEEANLVLLEEMSDLQWTMLLSSVQAQITLGNLNQPTHESRFESIPTLTLEQLKTYDFSHFEPLTTRS